jgi:S1-C subfamily serine protease
MTEPPPIYRAVRAVGTLRPKFNPSQGRVFSDDLQVMGTAFWLKKEKVLITCAHVVASLVSAPIEVAGLLVIGKANQYQRATIASVDIVHDLAVLALVGDNNQVIVGADLDGEASSGLELQSGYQPVSTPVAYAGFPLGIQLMNEVHSPTYSEGVIGVERRTTPQRKEIQISGAVIGGYSGSPVVLRSQPDKVIGVISHGPNTGGASGDIFMAISWEHVQAIANLATS